MIRILIFLACCTAAFATPLCVSGGSLASYEALGVSGCIVDASIPLIVEDFSYGVLSSSSPGVVTPDTDIFVTPVVLGSGHPGIELTSDTFSVTGTDFVNYQIGFTWDLPDIRSGDDILTDPVVAPGLAEVTTGLCLGAEYTGTSCSMSTASLTVFDDGISPVLMDADAISSVGVMGVLDTLELTGGGTGSAEITGFQNDITLAPEPSSWLLAVTGVAALAWRRRRER
jgi:MYXO-CTERM domain-containing protein